MCKQHVISSINYIFTPPFGTLTIFGVFLSIDAPIEVNTADNTNAIKPVVNQPFTLTCPLEANPPATYSWFKYHTLDRIAAAPDFSDNMCFSFNKRQWSVDWYQSHHNGLYVCHAYNTLGNGSYSHDTLFYLQADCKFCIVITNTLYNVSLP